MSDSERLPVGKCPRHGIVVEDDLNYNFPNEPTCAICDTVLDQVVMADAEEVDRHV